MFRGQERVDTLSKISSVHLELVCHSAYYCVYAILAYDCSMFNHVSLLSLCILCDSPDLWNHIEYQGCTRSIRKMALRVLDRTVESFLWLIRDRLVSKLYFIDCRIIVIQHALLSYNLDYVHVVGFSYSAYSTSSMIQHYVLLWGLDSCYTLLLMFSSLHAC